MKTKAAKTRKFAAIVMAFALCAAVLLPATNAQAATCAKQKSITITVKSGSYQSIKWTVKKNKNYKAKVKIVSVSGSPAYKTVDTWGWFGTNTEKGSFFYSLKTKKLKKNKTLTSDDYFMTSGGATFEVPEGIKKMKLKVTIYSVDKSKSVKSVKKSNSYY